MCSLDTRRIGNSDKLSGGSLVSGQVLQDRYEIQGVLGIGGFSAVYQARDLRFPNVEKLCALKEMANHAPDPAMRETNMINFEREANILATLSHPSIPQVYDYFSENDRAYLVMEFIDGRDLEALIDDSTSFLPQEQVLTWALELCEVLTFLHNHNPAIIFRDMKPSNIMLDKQGQLKLIDYNVAKNFQPGQKGTMIGTEGYSPPEQYRGVSEPRIDIYALGATLHHLLTRQNPQVEPPFSFHERPIMTANPNVDAEFAQVIMRALEYEPDRRYDTVDEMRRALKSLRPAKNLNKTISDVRQGTDLIPLWTFSCEDEIRSAPTVASGQVFVGAYDHNLYALDADSGKFLWKYATDGGIATTPCVTDDLVLFGSQDRVLYCVNVRTGRLKWTCPSNDRIYSSPRVKFGHVFFGSDDGFIRAAKLETGREVWKSETEGMVRSTALLSEENVYFGSNDGYLYALDLTAGSLKWRYQARGAIVSSPARYEDSLIVGSDDRYVHSVDAQSGWRLWRFRTGKAVVSSPEVHGKIVYIGSADGHLYALDALSGRELWKYATDGQITAPPTVHQDAIYFGSVDQHIYCLDLEIGTLRWKFPTGGPITSKPIAVEDILYVTSTDHLVYALPI